MSNVDTFHAGELQVQHRAGESAIAERNGRVIGDTIPPGARPFLEAQSMLVLGSVDPNGELWASTLFGREGFVRSSSDGRALHVEHVGAPRDARDSLWNNVQHDARLGVLAIELGSRRRLRVNGRLSASTEERWALQVDEAYPNCPKYIQRRHLAVSDLSVSNDAALSWEGTVFGDAERAIVQAADTCFVASAHPEHGVDASHRGGPPGFVELLDERTLRVPDYAGNSMFNTLGNLALNPRAGLVFLDFENGRLLQLSGRAHVRWDLEDPEGRSAGTQRFWDFEVRRWRSAPLPLGLAWEFLDASPFTPRPL